MPTPPRLPPLLGPEREAALARTIELGVLADHALAQPWTGDATEPELARIVEEGRAAWQEFLTANLRLAALLARQAARRTGMGFDDLFQEACVALGHAVQRYDHTRGRFSTYALPVISQHLTRVTSSLAGLLGLPTGRAVALRRAQGLAEQLGQELGRTAELAEISAALGRDPAWTARLLSHRPPLSLDLVAGAVVAVGPALDGSEDQAVFTRLLPELERLPGDQREVLGLRFGFADGRCHSYREIALRCGMSPSSVRRVEQRGLATLRDRHLGPEAPRSATG